MIAPATIAPWMICIFALAAACVSVSSLPTASNSGTSAPAFLEENSLDEHTERKQLEKEVLEISALEQRRIGQELHDGVSQELAGLSMMVDALAQQLKDLPAPLKTILGCRTLPANRLMAKVMPVLFGIRDGVA